MPTVIVRGQPREVDADVVWCGEVYSLLFTDVDCGLPDVVPSDEEMRDILAQLGAAGETEWRAGE